jgi:hypothetical protein
MEDESALGNSIKGRRRELGLSLNHLADATGPHRLFGFLGGEASGGLAGRVVAGEVGRGPSGSVATKPT